MKKIFQITGALLLILIGLGICTSSGQAVGVRPMVLDLDMKPGETREFEIILTPSDQEESIQMDLFQPHQLSDGSLVFEAADAAVFPAVKWVELEQTQINLSSAGDVTVRGKVKVPYDAGGSYIVIIMIKPQTINKLDGVSLRVRYAVRLNIRVDRPGLRASGKISELGVIKGKNGEPVLKVNFSNPSVWDYLVQGEVTIRNGERKLLERIVLKTPVGFRNNKEATRVYPGSNVEFYGQISKILQPGTYQVRAFFKYGEYGQLIENQEVTIGDDFRLPNVSELGAVIVDQEAIQMELGPGQRKSQAIKVTNLMEQPTRVTVTGLEVEAGYPYSLMDWIQLQTAPEFEIAGERNGRLLLTFVVPRDLPSASYHGKILLSAFSPTGELLSEKEVPISILVGDEASTGVSLQTLFAKKVEEGTLISLDLLNTGDRYLNPWAELILTHSETLEEQRVYLKLADGVNEILPTRSQLLTGVIETLAPGEYQAQVMVHWGQEEAQAFERILTIEE